ncbi:hypothetical protein DSECCO2_614820 [anaerobic digester metagenome]
MDARLSRIDVKHGIEHRRGVLDLDLHGNVLIYAFGDLAVADDRPGRSVQVRVDVRPTRLVDRGVVNDHRIVLDRLIGDVDEGRHIRSRRRSDVHRRRRSNNRPKNGHVHHQGIRGVFQGVRRGPVGEGQVVPVGEVRHRGPCRGLLVVDPEGPVVRSLVHNLVFNVGNR